MSGTSGEMARMVAPSARPPLAIVVMGVAGSGKSVVGVALAEALGARFIEGDRLHPAENVARMAAGIALTDIDRAGWLDAVGRALGQQVRAGAPAVAACSALKRRYREALALHAPSLLFVHLAVERDTARLRVAARRDHFMPPSLVDSQFADLEPPADNERSITVDANRPLDEVIETILAVLQPG